MQLIPISLLSLVSLSSSYILTLPFNELATILGGTGKARTFWNFMRKGQHPLLVPVQEGWTEKTQGLIHDYLGGRPLISTTATKEFPSPCGTRKFLQRLCDGNSVESVLIPSIKHDRTTLCISTQIGCDRGCAFCLTGQMGLIRNLTAEEMVSQVFLGMGIAQRERLPPMRNVVLMGMGDAGRNTDEVGKAVATLADRDRLQMAQGKITISTVGPSPEVFSTLARMPGGLAWSLHAADDKLRRLLVPSTRHSTEQLRDGLIAALASRTSERTRTVMLAVTLVDGVNDSSEQAERLADFVQPIYSVTPNVMIDLIPYNDISIPEFRRPSRETVNAFQQVLRQRGVFCSVRITRGDEEFAACGMLATERVKKTVARTESKVDNTFRHGAAANV